MKILVPVSPLEKQDPSMKESRHSHSVNINSSCAWIGGLKGINLLISSNGVHLWVKKRKGVINDKRNDSNKERKQC